MRVEDIFYGDPFESGLAMPPGFMGGVAVPEPQETPTPVPTIVEPAKVEVPAIYSGPTSEATQEEQAGVTPPLPSNLLYTSGQLGSITDAYKDVLASGATTDDPDEVGAYYDLGLRESEETSGLDPFADTFGSEAAGMGGAATALSNIVSAEDYAASTTDYTPELSQDQGDFTGKLNRFTATPQEDLGDFQNEIRTLLLDKVPEIQATTGANYEQALYTAYTQDPDVQQLMGQYGVNPFFADGTGQYLYDPFSFGELRTYEINESDFATAVRTGAAIAAGALLSQAGAGVTELLGGTLPTGVGLAIGASPSAMAGGTAGEIDASVDFSTATGGFAGPLNMLTATPGAAAETLTTTDETDDPLLTAIDIAEELQEGGLFTTVNPLAGAQIPPVTEEQVEEEEEEEVTGGGGAEAQPPTFTQEQVDAQIAEAVAGATEGLLTQEQADKATQEAIDNLPADTTEFNQADIDKAVAEATKGLSTAAQVNTAVKDAVDEALKNLPEDTTPFTQEDIDSAVTKAIDALPEDTTLFDQGDIDTAVAKAVGETTTTLESDFATERTGLESTIEGLEGELTTAGKTIEGLEGKLDTATTSLEDLQTQRQEEIEGYQTSITELENALKNLEIRKDLAIRSGDEKLAAMMTDYEQQIKDALEKAEQEFSEERGTLESQIKEEQQEITELESAISGLQSSLETSETTVASLETKLETANTTAADLESKLETSKNTSAELKNTLESTQTALKEQKEVTKAKEANIESLTTSVNTLTGTVSDLSTKLTEVTAAKDKAIEDGNKALADAMEQAEKTLQTTKAEAQETLDNAIAAGNTKEAAAVEAGQKAVADAVAAGEAAVAAAEAAGDAAVASAVAKGEADVAAATAAGEAATAAATAKGEADVAAAVAAGEAAATAAEAAGREAGFGEGRGTGRGEGFGAGTGLGLALGAGVGMLQPQTVTKTMFEDFEFEKKYKAPEILAGLKKPPVYKAPEVGLFQGII